MANSKRDIQERSGQLEDRALIDFAFLALLAGVPLNVASVSTACSCLVLSYTAPTVTVTAAGKTTVTVAVAKATVEVTTTVKAVTV